MLDDLNQRWHRLFIDLSPIKLIKQSFHDLTKKYAEPHRYYHNLSHIMACLNHFDQIKNQLEDPFCVECHHDVRLL